MISRFLTFLALLVIPMGAARGQVGGFEYGPRPPDSVFDPTGLLEMAELRQLSEPLAKIHKDEGIDVIVVVLADLEGAPPEYVAKRFSLAWCESPIHAVVLHVRGDPGSPWIVPGGKLVGNIKPEVLARDVEEAMHRASLEPTEIRKIPAAATEAGDRLRYWTGNAINRSEFLESERVKIRLEMEAKSRNWRIIKLMGVASVIPVLVGVGLLFWLLRKPGPRRFPERHPPRRLGAPHAGGNQAVSTIGAPLN